jgi:hypothetical protein
MTRTVDQALGDAQIIQREIERNFPRIDELHLDRENLESLGERCIVDAIQPRTCADRYAESVRLAAICFAIAEHMPVARVRS